MASAIKTGILGTMALGALATLTLTMTMTLGTPLGALADDEVVSGGMQPGEQVYDSESEAWSGSRDSGTNAEGQVSVSYEVVAQPQVIKTVVPTGTVEKGWAGLPATGDNVAPLALAGIIALTGMAIVATGVGHHRKTRR